MSRRSPTGGTRTTTARNKKSERESGSGSGAGAGSGSQSRGKSGASKVRTHVSRSSACGVTRSLAVQQAALEELPLLLPKAAKSSGTLLLQIAHEKFNLQGDMGAVGRLASTDKGLILDLKGVI